MNEQPNPPSMPPEPLGCEQCGSEEDEPVQQIVNAVVHQDYGALLRVTLPDNTIGWYLHENVMSLCAKCIIEAGPVYKNDEYLLEDTLELIGTHNVREYRGYPDQP